MVSDEPKMEPEDIELAFRRLASKQNNPELEKLINSIFVTSAEDGVKHEMNSGDKKEDKKEGD